MKLITLIKILSKYRIPILRTDKEYIYTKVHPTNVTYYATLLTKVGYVVSYTHTGSLRINKPID